jgi:hypothetical protein
MTLKSPLQRGAGASVLYMWHQLNPDDSLPDYLVSNSSPRLQDDIVSDHLSKPVVSNPTFMYFPLEDNTVGQLRRNQRSLKSLQFKFRCKRSEECARFLKYFWVTDSSKYVICGEIAFPLI